MRLYKHSPTKAGGSKDQSRRRKCRAKSARIYFAGNPGTHGARRPANRPACRRRKRKIKQISTKAIASSPPARAFLFPTIHTSSPPASRPHTTSSTGQQITSQHHTSTSPQHHQPAHRPHQNTPHPAEHQQPAPPHDRPPRRRSPAERLPAPPAQLLNARALYRPRGNY